MKKKFNLKMLLPVFGAAAVYLIAYVAITQGLMSRSMQSLLIRMCYSAVLAVSLNLVVGFLGELSLGHAGFYALGAYAGCIFAVNTNFPIVIKFIGGVLIGGGVAAIGGFLISGSILRLRGDYLAIVTLAFGEIIRSFAKILPFTGGTKGLTGVPSFATKLQAFTWAYIVLLITIIVVHNLVNSRHGRAITAIRDNSIVVESIGIEIGKFKMKVFAIAAFFAGAAGVIFGFYKTIVEPGDFTYNVSIEVLVMVVLGGMGNILGSVIAACIIVLLPEFLRGADQYRMPISAIALIAMMLANASPTVARAKEAVSCKVSVFKTNIMNKLKKSDKKE
ncbi:MAG: branched-chain amino acid ABC transporter permease, partial [Oscillospiraceae bacterium]|nr:branched-chain amino acid ABC transporter permease [Oscillospiraceae bacterium]